jgi:hypothetical protein
MEVPFSQQEIDAIKQLAQMMDVSPHQVIIQAVRMYQLYKMGKVQLLFPRVISGCSYEVVEDTPAPEDIPIVAPV